MQLRLMVIDDRGREWLVRDGVVVDRTFIPLTLGDRNARFRIFDLHEPHVRRVFLFPRDDDHGVHGVTLEMQFLEATTVEHGEWE